MTDADVITACPAPSDGVTRVCFSPCGSWLLVAGWSGELALHSSTHGAQASAASAPCALLSACWGPPAPTASSVYGAGLDGRVYHARLTQATLSGCTPLGEPSAADCATATSPAPPHAQAVSCMCALPRGGGDGGGDGGGALVTGSWDGIVRVWDAARDAPNGYAGSTIAVNAGAKVFAMDAIDAWTVALVTAAKRVRVLDVRKVNAFVHNLSAPFDAPLRTVSASPLRPVLALGSTDGRVAVETLDESRAMRFAFKCHRMDGRAYPVNCIVHNSKYGSFATGGGDGHVSVWDGVARKRIYQYPKEATSIASLDYDHANERLAVAISYTFEEGERDRPLDKVVVRKVSDPEIRTRDIASNADTA